MTKVKKKKNAKVGRTHDDFRNNETYHVELTVAKAHSRIMEVLQENGWTKADLAKEMGCSRAHVTSMLDESRNLTFRTFGKILFALGCEPDFNVYDIGTKRDFVPYQKAKVAPAQPESVEAAVTLTDTLICSSRKHMYRDKKITWSSPGYSITGLVFAPKVNKPGTVGYHTLEDLDD